MLCCVVVCVGPQGAEEVGLPVIPEYFNLIPSLDAAGLRFWVGACVMLFVRGRAWQDARSELLSLCEAEALRAHREREKCVGKVAEGLRKMLRHKEKVSFRDASLFHLSQLLVSRFTDGHAQHARKRWGEQRAAATAVASARVARTHKLLQSMCGERGPWRRSGVRGPEVHMFCTLDTVESSSRMRLKLRQVAEGRSTQIFSDIILNNTHNTKPLEGCELDSARSRKCSPLRLRLSCVHLRHRPRLR